MFNPFFCSESRGAETAVSPVNQMVLHQRRKERRRIWDGTMGHHILGSIIVVVFMIPMNGDSTIIKETRTGLKNKSPE